MANAALGFAGKQSSGRGWRNEPDCARVHEHAYTEYTLVIQGTVRSLVSGEERLARAGTLVILQEHVPHDFIVESDQAVFWVLCLSPELVDSITEELTEALVRDAGPWHDFEGLGAAVIEDELEQIRQELLTQTDGWVRLVALNLERILIRCRRLRGMNSGAELHVALSQALAQLDMAGREGCRVSELAEKLHISQGHLRRVFSTLYGLSPKEYLMRWRLSRAKMLLSQTTLAVGEVAEMTGFGDIHHFSASFRRSEGVAPTVWRRR